MNTWYEKAKPCPKRADDVRKSFVESERFLSAIHKCLCIHYAIWTQYLYVKVLESPNICVCILQKSRIITYDLRNIYWSIALKICKIHMNCVILNRLMLWTAQNHVKSQRASAQINAWKTHVRISHMYHVWPIFAQIVRSGCVTGL